MKLNYKRLGDYIQEVDTRNSGDKILELWGVSIEKKFIKSVANIIGTDLAKYKIVNKNQFVCSLMQVSRDEKIPIALWKNGTEIIVSPAYKVFEIINTDYLLPKYLNLWFCRTEFDREASYYGVGGVRGSLDWSDFCDIQLPIPSLDEQQKIVDAYNVIENRIALKRKINDNLEAQMSAIFREFVSIVDESDVSIYNILSVTNGAAFSSEYFNSDGIGFPLIRIRDLKNSCPEVYSSEVLPNAVHINAGDIVIGMDGEFSPYIWIGETGLLNQRVCKVSPTNANIHPFFLYATLKPILTEIERTQGGTTVIHLGKKDFDNITCANLSDTKHIEYNNLIAPMYAELVANSRETLSLVKFNQLLLSSLSR